MNPGNPFPASANLSMSHEDSTITVDSNVFPPEVNKIVTKGIRREKFWIKCDGSGHMDFRRIVNPIKEIEQLSKLMDKNLITAEQFEQAKKILLDRI